ncbi:MAG: GDSL-type esterase/lipase family protein [Deltaproteobacteria bacterium]|jgi:lysophospholipase L1-like esterase|nr:GDSL-type esterase/lipase family protein [Deltaproteobacteria bacterium]
MDIVCFGDSICYGDGVRPDQAWVSLLAAGLLQRRPEARVRNAGVNGETAWEGLRRLPMFLASPVPDLLYVQFGLNDAWLGACSAEEYADAIREIVLQALESGVRSVLVGTNHPVWIEQDMYGGADYPPRVRQFNASLRSRLALAPERVALADIEAHWDALGGKNAQIPLLQADGVHLSVGGNRVYADLLLPMFVQLL